MGAHWPQWRESKRSSDGLGLAGLVGGLTSAGLGLGSLRFATGLGSTGLLALTSALGSAGLLAFGSAGLLAGLAGAASAARGAAGGVSADRVVAA